MSRTTEASSKRSMWLRRARTILSMSEVHVHASWHEIMQHVPAGCASEAGDLSPASVEPASGAAEAEEAAAPEVDGLPR